jgi:hypothetical protein
LKGRLNLFQASMLRWRELYPYSAVHVVRIADPLDVARLQRAIDDQLAGSGLTGLDLDVERRRYEYKGGAARASLSILPAESDPSQTLTREIERQLNEPFASDGRINPFRFFALDRGQGFDLGLAYDHFVAAGDSIALLLKAIADRYRPDTAVPVARRGPDLYPPTYRRLFLRKPVAALAGMRRMPAIATSFRRAFRPRYPRGRDPYNGFAHFRVDRSGFAAMRSAAKAWGVTLNDLLLSMLLLALVPMTEDRRGQRRRNELAVASIVNIRRDCGADASHAFGQFLSSFLVSHPVPFGVTLEQLTRDVHAETARIKRERLYLQTLVVMSVSGILWRFLSPARRARFHDKAYPVWAGLTAVNVDALWEQAGAPAPPPAYVRGVSTGPLTPLVVAATTAAGMLAIGLTFRTAAFTREEIDKIAASLLANVESLGR